MSKTKKEIKKRGRPKKKKLILDGDFLDINELSKLLRISKSHIYTLTSNRQIPHIKILGKKLLFNKQEIYNWLEPKKVKAKKLG